VEIAACFSHAGQMPSVFDLNHEHVSTFIHGDIGSDDNVVPYINPFLGQGLGYFKGKHIPPFLS